ncbi:MAG: ferredoxin [Nanoarchaeota archaeon]
MEHQKSQSPAADNEEYEIEYDRDGCIGAGSCAAVAKNNWVMAEDGKATVRKLVIKASELQENLDAARACPVNVIHIKNKKTGERLI